MMERDDGEAGCPRAERAEAYAARTLPRAEMPAFEEHFFSCDRCWNEVLHALELRAAFAGRTERRRGAPGWLPLAAAAGLAGLVLLATHGDRPTTRDEPVHREPATAAASIRVTTEASRERLTASWFSVDGADRYRISLLDAAGNPLLERETTGRRIEVHRSTLPGAASAELYWRVRAEDDLRQLLADSGPIRAGSASRKAP